jgi:hypothetical protein
VSFMTARQLSGRRRYSSLGVVAIVFAGAVLQSGRADVARPQTSAAYSRAVIGVCSGALLFEEEHEIGTRAGALAVSRDIRASGDRRLRRVDRIPKPAASVRLAVRWIELEERLVDTYAGTYLRIWDAIEHARTATDRARLPMVLHRLVHAPDALARQAATLETRLGVPDCTGGTVPPAAPVPPGAA